MAVMGFKRLLPILFELSVLGAADEEFARTSTGLSKRGLPTSFSWPTSLVVPDNIKSMTRDNPGMIPALKEAESVLHNPTSVSSLINSLKSLYGLDEGAQPTITSAPRSATVPPIDWTSVFEGYPSTISDDVITSIISKELGKYIRTYPPSSAGGAPSYSVSFDSGVIPVMGPLTQPSVNWPITETSVLWSYLDALEEQETLMDVEKRAQPTITDDLTAAASGFTPVLPASVDLETSDYGRHITHLAPSATTKVRAPAWSWEPPARQGMVSSGYEVVYVGASDGTAQHVEEAKLPNERAELQARPVEEMTVGKTIYRAKPTLQVLVQGDAYYKGQEIGHYDETAFRTLGDDLALSTITHQFFTETTTVPHDYATETEIPHWHTIVKTTTLPEPTWTKTEVFHTTITLDQRKRAVNGAHIRQEGPIESPTYVIAAPLEGKHLTDLTMTVGPATGTDVEYTAVHASLGDVTIKIPAVTTTSVSASVTTVTETTTKTSTLTVDKLSTSTLLVPPVTFTVTKTESVYPASTHHFTVTDTNTGEIHVTKTIPVTSTYIHHTVATLTYTQTDKPPTWHPHGGVPIADGKKAKKNAAVRREIPFIIPDNPLSSWTSSGLPPGYSKTPAWLIRPSSKYPRVVAARSAAEVTPTSCVEAEKREARLTSREDLMPRATDDATATIVETETQVDRYGRTMGTVTETSIITPRTTERVDPSPFWSHAPRHIGYATRKKHHKSLKSGVYRGTYEISIGPTRSIRYEEIAVPDPTTDAHLGARAAMDPPPAWLTKVMGDFANKPQPVGHGPRIPVDLVSSIAHAVGVAVATDSPAKEKDRDVYISPGCHCNCDKTFFGEDGVVPGRCPCCEEKQKRGVLGQQIKLVDPDLEAASDKLNDNISCGNPHKLPLAKDVMRGIDYLNHTRTSGGFLDIPICEPSLLGTKSCVWRSLPKENEHYDDNFNCNAERVSCQDETAIHIVNCDLHTEFKMRPEEVALRAKEILSSCCLGAPDSDNCEMWDWQDKGRGPMKAGGVWKHKDFDWYIDVRATEGKGKDC